MCVEPSSTLPGPLRWAVGATFATETLCVSVLPVSPSSSVALTLTVLAVVAEPSGKVHLKEPDEFVFVSEPATLSPLAPQLVETAETSSTPGSEIE